MNRQEFFTILSDVLPYHDLVQIQKAYWLVKEAHRKESRRLTGERYFEHVRRVALLAFSTYGYHNPDIVILSLIHDVVEDTYVPPSIIVDMFGTQMYEWALVLSKEVPVYHPVTGKLMLRGKLPEVAYYHSLMGAGEEPQLVKGCDRLDNVKDLEHWGPARQWKYIIETEEYVLPVIEAVDSRIYNDIKFKTDLCRETLTVDGFVPEKEITDRCRL